MGHWRCGRGLRAGAGRVEVMRLGLVGLSQRLVRCWHRASRLTREAARLARRLASEIALAGRSTHYRWHGGRCLSVFLRLAGVFRQWSAREAGE